MLRVCAVLLLTLLMTGCGYDTLYSNLEESQANEMLALLLREGFDARKVSTDDTWMLEISRDHLPLAVDTLKASGFPRDGFQSLGEIFQKEGFVSSPLEERARLIHGLSQELSRTVSNIDGVVMARVHLAIPERNSMSDSQAPSSASVFIKHQMGTSLDKHTSSIKALVVNSVEGLPYDNVTVSFFEAEAARSVRPQSKTTQIVMLDTLKKPEIVSLGSILITLVIGALGLKLRMARHRRPVTHS